VVVIIAFNSVWSIYLCKIMTKISIYKIDDKVTGSDKWIGSDSQTQYSTKNFTPTKLSEYFNENQVIDIGVPIRYKYDILEVGDTRLPGTITFDPQVGTPYNISNITSFLLSKYTLKGNDVSDYLNFLTGTKVLIHKADDINIFGLFRMVKVEEYLPEPNFFKITLSYYTGNGAIIEDKDYLISLVDVSTGGTDITKTSQLINDGEDGIHPFVTAEDIPSAVYDGASPTTVTVGGLNATTDISGQTISHIIEQIVAPYVIPTLSFYTNDISIVVESGTTLSGLKSFDFSFTQLGNITANSLKVRDVTTSTIIGTGLSITSPHSVNIGTITINGNGTQHVWSSEIVATNTNVITSNSFTTTSYYKQFYGDVTSLPVNSAQVRALPNYNYSYDNSFITPVVSSTKFSLSIPSTKSLVSVITANFENITASFTETIFNVNDAGGNAISYKTLSYESGVPLGLTLTITLS